MMGDPDPAVSPFKPPFITPDEPLFDFSTTDWIDPPVFTTTLPETNPESNIRAQTETEYRLSTTPTAWNRYITLGRYVTDGFTFDSIMAEGINEPHKMYCLIWYQYKYYTDHLMEISLKLQAWALQRAEPYLLQHSVSAFNLNTMTTTWTDFSRTQKITNPWSEVKAKQKKEKKTKILSTSYATAASLLGKNKPGTITEESSKASSDTRGQKRSATREEKSVASDGKQSVLIQENSSVPVSDGTYRVTLRWKTTLDTNSLSRQTSKMKEEIYKLLNDIFDDDDGHLYKWQQSGTDQLNSISKMTPTEVRQYISPSISILPSQSMIVIPLRFGFLGNTPAKWRNQESTKKKLELHNVTVSFSNCTSLSGNLVVAGYILLKAPMTTHRLRYLQSLRQILPTNTPPFDILLHKRSPVSDQQIPHLAVQCGNTHVHSLSESLATILTGESSALYIPRFVLSQMSELEAASLFSTHDNHVKSLRWLALAPLLSNLDRPRKEYLPDGQCIERTTREWARSIKNSDGNGSAQCDVVNGGLDQLCYLLFPPQSTEVATKALEEYRRRLYPFSQRESQFRENIGPPPFIHLSRSVIANLEFIKRLSTSTSQCENSATSSEPTFDQNDTSTVASPDSDATDSSMQKAERPPTPLESLRKIYSQRTLNSDSSNQSDDDSTDASTATEPSKLSEGRMSTSSAKIRELDAVLQRQKKTSDKKEAKNSERLSHIERQLHRIDDIDPKLEEVKRDFGMRLNLLEGRLLDTVSRQMENTNSAFMKELISEVTDTLKLYVTDDRQTVNASTAAVDRAVGSSSSSNSHSSSSRSSLSAESSTLIQSPEHKRLRSRKKKPLNESIRRHLDKDLASASQLSEIARSNSFSSLDAAMQPIEDMLHADRQSAESTTVKTNSPDQDSQYTEADSKTQEESNAPSSPGPATSS